MNLLSKNRPSILAAFLAFASLMPVAHAQIERTVGSVNVPFAFDVGLHHYPAGVYDMQTLGNSILVIRGASRSGLATMRVDKDVAPAEKATAVFLVYGNKRVLQEVRGSGPGQHLVFYQSKAERRETLASTSAHPVGIQLALVNTPR
jgi:hypothetical protein